MTSRSHLARTLLGLLAVWLGIAAPAARSETSPEAQGWLTKMMAIFDSGPFTLDYVVHLDLEQMGQPIQGELGGKITYGDRHHKRMEMRMKLSGLPGAGGDGSTPMELDLLTVSDGEILWTEIDMAGMGLQVMKISVEEAEKLAESQAGAGFAGNPASMDPVAQLEMLTSILDFEVVEESGGRVTLRGKNASGSPESLGGLGTLGVDTFDLVIDARTGFPIEIRAGDPEPVIRMELENLRQVSRDALPDGIFVYEPPEGVTVTDLAGVLGSAGR